MAENVISKDDEEPVSSSGRPVPDRRPRSRPLMIGGRYGLFEQIGSGGMARVYLGRLFGSGGFTRVVAIKRMHRQLAREAEFVTMFRDEVRLTSRILHPN